MSESGLLVREPPRHYPPGRGRRNPSNLNRWERREGSSPINDPNLSNNRWYALKVNETGDGESFKRWESATRTAVSLATKLRLAPSTRLDKKTAERMGEEPEGPKPSDLPA